MNPISAVILKMSESAAWERRISSWPVTRRVVERFMPGEQLDDAVAAAHRINAEGMSVSLNPVGEHVHSADEADTATRAYVEILERIRDEGLDGNMSLKLSLLGLDLGADVAAGCRATNFGRSRRWARRSASSGRARTTRRSRWTGWLRRRA